MIQFCPICKSIYACDEHGKCDECNRKDPLFIDDPKCIVDEQKGNVSVMFRKCDECESKANKKLVRRCKKCGKIIGCNGGFCDLCHEYDNPMKCEKVLNSVEFKAVTCWDCKSDKS